MKNKNNKNLFVAILFVSLACALAVAGWTLLPDTLVTQIGLSGEASNTLPKWAALTLPTALTAVFSFLYAKDGEKKNLVVAAVGLLVLVLTFVFNS